VVLRASGSDVYDRSFRRYGNFASVQSVLIPPCASRAQVDAVAPIVDRADAVYFAGGDQAHYVAWKGTALVAAVTRLYARGGVVGGGSAGLAVQGAVVYDALAADRLDVETATRDAVENPLETRISFTTGLFAWPPLAATITDTHFVARDRFGRSVAFLALILRDRILPGVRTVYALGVDQGSSVVVDASGSATVLDGAGGHGAYLIYADAPAKLSPSRPLRYTVCVAHIARDGERFDLLHKRTARPCAPITVDGARTPMYSRDPYAR
jgi:cyanophycinase-like exopeptidase